jgi:flagellar motility protein MotE (MotC chaperone)
MKIRVLPIVITGAALLLTLKAAGLVLTGHYAFEEAEPAPRVAVQPTYRPSAAAHTSNSWSVAEYDPIVTGSVPQKKQDTPETPPADAAPEAKKGEAEAAPEVPKLDKEPTLETDLQAKDPEDLSSAEKALLDRLRSRREELDSRAQELDLRENLLRAAEKKIEERITELKATEERLAALQNARKAEDEAKLKDLVIMYENMKPKEAAEIFDRLDLKVLVDVATKMNPKKTGEIIAKMEPAAAEKLTVALAQRQERGTAQLDPSALPKIEGEKLN